MEERFELTRRSYDALVLTYSPKKVISRDSENVFYIPSTERIKESFEHSIKSIDKLEKRIEEGTRGVSKNERDRMSSFDRYFLPDLSINLAHTWVRGMGDLYRFKKGERKKALQNFDDYWNNKEKEQWEQIQELMIK